MGEFEQAARDLVDRANAGDEVAWATLHLVGENARKGSPFRACIVYELAMQYAKSKSDFGSDGRREFPREAHEWLWSRSAKGIVGDRPDLFQYLKGCEYGEDACVTALAMGPRLTNKRIDKILSTFQGDPVGAKIAAKGLDDPSLENLPELISQVDSDAAPTVEGCYFIGACLMNARIRQCIVSGNFSACRELAAELGRPSQREVSP
jgi:hypothetical protein